MLSFILSVSQSVIPCFRSVQIIRQTSHVFICSFMPSFLRSLISFPSLLVLRFIFACMEVCIQSAVPSFMCEPCVLACIHSYIYFFLRFFLHAFVQSFDLACVSIHSSMQAGTHAFIQSLSILHESCVHSFTCSFLPSFSYSRWLFFCRLGEMKRTFI